MTDATADVVVVGAGPAGLALALQAHDHGARVRVLERRPDPERPSRALIVHPRTLEVLRPLGVTDALLDGGDRSQTVRLHLGRREVEVRLGDFDLPDTPFPHLLFIRQAVVERVLAEALADRGVEVERGVEVVAHGDDGDLAGADVRRNGGVERIACRFLVGGDGAGSAIREASGVAWRGKPYRREVVLADLELDGDLAPGVAHAVAARPGVLVLFALGEHATWRMLATRAAIGGDAPAGQPDGPVPVGELQTLLHAAGLTPRITHVGWSARVRLEHRLASSYRRGPVFLVGDAAHLHSPAGGLGMNTGIQDAQNLGWKLALAARSDRCAGELDVLLDSYEAERRPVAQRVTALTDLLFWAESGTDPVAALARTVTGPLVAPVVPLLLRRRRMIAAGIRSLSQLRVHHRGSALSVEGSPPGRRGPRPGERLPDATVDVGGRRRRLHDVVGVPGIHVLLERSAVDLDGEDLGPHVSVHRLADRSGSGLTVVRPDGFVGYRCGVVDTAQLRRWLGMVAALPGRDAR
jgi:2-polyprenyl-6-methoxyphenol hydroxylase-like FAD-dependent oxidoreductase